VVDKVQVEVRKEAKARVRDQFPALTQAAVILPRLFLKEREITSMKQV
jgi:hypothetical protein